MVTLPFAAQAARLWRRLLADELAAQGVPAAIVEDVLLVASELAGNAVLHARPLVDGSLHGGWEIARGRLTLELVDGGSRSGTSPHPRDVCADRPTGRGLALVEALVAEWGFEESRDHGRTVTRVWAVLPLGRIPAGPGVVAV